MQAIFEKYNWEVLDISLINQGLINQTWEIKTKEKEYILQTVNHTIFKDPWAIDYNINWMGSYLKKYAPHFIFTHLIPTRNGETLVEFDGKFYRAFNKIQGKSYDVLSNGQQAKEAAAAFANYTHSFIEADATQLKNTLPDFHNLSLRYTQFSQAVQNGNLDRINQSKEAIQFLQSNQSIVNTYEKFIQHTDSRKRVTHHDTKISNVLFNNQDQAICVIDLDTTMAGYFISDVGDICRTYLCTVSEEENNLDLIQVVPDRWVGVKEGYLKIMQPHLSNFELDHFEFSGEFLIYMQALRFLTDHLNNDSYYGAKYNGQNYVRAVNQIRLLESYRQLIL
jgi:Ser/Thr protein kinase RdoA (MazF antagonist)